MAVAFQAAQERRKDDYDRDVVLGWNVVRIYAMTMEKKRMPDLTSLLSQRASGPRRQTRTEMRAALHHIANTHGLTIRTKHG